MLNLRRQTLVIALLFILGIVTQIAWVQTAVADDTEELCHWRDGSRDWEYKVVGPGALKDHLMNHPNDGVTGGEVPGHPDLMFTDDCETETAGVECTGTAPGTCSCFCTSGLGHLFTVDTLDACASQCELQCEAMGGELGACGVKPKS